MARFHDNLQRLASLAGEGADHDPTRLFAGISELFLSDDHAPLGKDRAAFAEILRRLLKAAAIGERRRVAEALARRPDAPAEIVRILAADDIAAARPLIVASAALTEDDLEAIARFGSAEHRKALVARPHLSRRVKAALIAAESDNDGLAALDRPPEEPGGSGALPALRALEEKLHGKKRHAIGDDVEKARAFLSRIDKGRRAKTTLSLLERANEHGLFSDVNESEEALSPEARSKAEEFLAAIDKRAAHPEAPAGTPETAREEPEASKEPRIEQQPERKDEPRSGIVVSPDLFQHPRPREQAGAGGAGRAADFARASADFAFEIDPDEAIVFLSDDAPDALGAAAEILGRRLAAIGAFTGHGNDARAARDAMVRRVPFRDQEFVIAGDAARSREPSVWLMSAVPLFDLRSGRFRGYRGTGARHRRKEEELRAAKAAEALNAAIGREAKRQENEARETAAIAADLSGRTERLAAMSHELKTPLNAIMGFSEVMADEIMGPIGETYRDKAGRIYEAAAHVNQTINDILDRTKLDEGALTVAAHPVALEPLLSDAVKATARESAMRRINRDYVTTATGAAIGADEVRARQILASLMRAMIALTPEGGRIALDVKTAGGKAAEINIWNDGPALPSDAPLTLKSPADALAPREGEAEAGLALTLSVARDLARLMGGDVTVQSKAGVGNRFRLTFPLAEPAA